MVEARWLQSFSPLSIRQLLALSLYLGFRRLLSIYLLVPSSPSNLSPRARASCPDSTLLDPSTRITLHLPRSRLDSVQPDGRRTP